LTLTNDLGADYYSNEFYARKAVNADGQAVRRRLVYAAFSLLVVVLGLASRKFAAGLPRFVAAYLGDILWALLVFLLAGFCRPRWKTARVAGLALAFAVCIEFSQLYHAPWLDAIRHTIPGRLALGDTFVWRDLLCYAAGVAMGVISETWANKRGGSLLS
jgi:hypothetical protein